MQFSLPQFFIDPLLRAPTIGSMLLGFVSALMGVIVFIKKRSLIGETLSHAAYPGLILGALISLFFSEVGSMFFLLGACITSFLGLFVIEKLESRFNIHPDSALCLVLSLFLGAGVLFASHLQFISPLSDQSAQVFLYGQAATMNDFHILFYSGLSFVVLTFFILNFRRLEITLFDQTFSKSFGVESKQLNSSIFILIIITLVIGIRSMGVVLISGMLIAPVAAARQWTYNLSGFIILSGLFGLMSGFCGNYFSIQIPLWIEKENAFTLPTGPMVLLSASCTSLFSFLFARKKGAVNRTIRAFCFRFQCLAENILKTFWKEEKNFLTKEDILKSNTIAPLILSVVLGVLKRGGWIAQKNRKGYSLTEGGMIRASRLVRLHRLWELYLASSMKIGEEKVHRSAEEMEHILTPEIEKKLTELLKNPKIDPHKQPIPNIEGMLCNK